VGVGRRGGSSYAKHGGEKSWRMIMSTNVSIRLYIKPLRVVFYTIGFMRRRLFGDRSKKKTIMWNRNRF
jgi:hypothetical protein